jgi:2-keto-4-pentenoate hydratase
MFEAEIAVHLGRDVDPGASREEVREAIEGMSAAIELADLNPPPEDPEAILAGNIFHRHVILGAVDDTRSGAHGIAGRVVRDGQEVASTVAPEALTGELLEIVRQTAEILFTCGERLRAGEVIITGSVIPPLAVAPGQRLTAELPPLAPVSVELG